MPLGHLMLGLLGGFAASLLTFSGGWPAWVVVADYVAVGNLVFAISVLGQMLSDATPRRGPLGPVST